MKQIWQLPYLEIPTAELSPADKELEARALEVARKAYAPYSNFLVGVALRLEDGTIITGSNQENAAYPSGICAERTALFYAGAEHPDLAPKEMLLLAVNSAGRVQEISPCGACRQVIMEAAMRYKPFRILLSGAEHTRILEDCRLLLPFGFDGSEL